MKDTTTVDGSIQQRMKPARQQKFPATQTVAKMSQTFRTILTVVVSLTALVRVGSDGMAQDSETQFPAGHYGGTVELPHIARYLTLPMRMDLEPTFVVPPNILKFDHRFPEFFDRTLRTTEDPELLELAALSVARLLREKLVNTSASFDILASHLAATTDERVRQACAQALVEGDIRSSAETLLKVTSNGDDTLRLTVEPALARWKYEPARAQWVARLSDRFATQSAVRLACEGLAALSATDSLPTLTELLQNSSATFGKQMAAAKAISQIDQAHALQQAKPLATGDIRERLLAVALLSSSDPASLTELARMCSDPADGVASAAWLAVFRLDHQRLQEHLPIGRTHRDAMVRVTTARVMREYPNAERAAWLNDLISDHHLEVRNVARQMLVQVARNQTELAPSIIAAAGDKTAGDSDDWQGIEQSLLLLGELHAAQFAEHCILLLSHPRSEVAVTAGWLLHLFPDPAVTERVVATITANEARLTSPPPGVPMDFEAVSLQQAHLYQYAGLTRQAQLQPLLITNFPKSAPGVPEKRAAGLWALGLINENKNDTQLAAQYVSRINDRDGMPPEWTIVRRISIMAIGMMRATGSADEVQRAYDIDGVITAIPSAARWALPLLGKEQPPEPEAAKEFVGGWKLYPTGKEEFRDVVVPSATTPPVN